MTKCGFCNEFFKKTKDYYETLYTGIAMNVKTNNYYGTHMGYCNECKKPATIMGPIWGIAMNKKNQALLWDFICGYCNE
jgi:hypothetical protein